MTFKQSKHGKLSFAAAVKEFFPTFFVHETSSAADIGLINFDGLSFTAHFFERSLIHCQADPMIHEPCGLLSNAQCAAKLIAADSVLRAADQPHCRKPFR